MIKLKNLKEVRLYGRTISELLDEFQKFEGRDFIFFDTETLGFNPEPEYIQLTQIGAILVDGATMKQKKTLNLKIQLTDSAKRFLEPGSWERTDWEKNKEGTHDKTPSEVLDMTGYFNDLPERLATEEQALKLFAQFINNANNPILVAHNAGFDMRFISVRAKRYGITIKKTEVVDTLRLAKYFLIPTLEKLEKSDVLKQLKRVKVMKVSDIKPDEVSANGKPKNKKHPKDTEFENFTAEDGTEMLRITYGKPSASLGKLTPVLVGKIEDWHDALADVKSMMLVYQKIIEILYANRNIDIAALQADEYRRYKKLKGHN